MAIVDVIIILIAFLGLVIGFKVGIFKELTDFVALFISMVLAGMFKGVVANLLYTVLPFYNFGKATEELYSVNIIFYQVIMYFLLLLFFLGVYQLIIRKIKLSNLIKETMVETNVISNILGAVIGVPLMILFLYNVMFFLKLPMFNIKELNSSKYATLIMEKTLIVSKCNKGLYLSNEYVLDTINNKKMKKKDKKYLDDKMVKSMVKNKIIKTSKVNKLYKEGLIYKYVKENKEETK